MNNKWLKQTHSNQVETHPLQYKVEVAKLLFELNVSLLIMNDSSRNVQFLLFYIVKYYSLKPIYRL